MALARRPSLSPTNCPLLAFPATRLDMSEGGRQRCRRAAAPTLRWPVTPTQPGSTDEVVAGRARAGHGAGRDPRPAGTRVTFDRIIACLPLSKLTTYTTA